MNYTRFLTNLSRRREPSIIREITALLPSASPDLVFLAGGLPNPNLFPFDEASIKLKNGTNIHLGKQQMASALQYGPTQGYPPLVDQLTSLVKRLHDPPSWENREVVITPGSQDGLCRAIEMLMVPNDPFLIQEPCYPGTLSILKPFTPRFLGVACDGNGLVPKSLKDALSSWKPEEIRNKSEGVPKAIYINPNAANPSGVSITTERRKEIYEIACEYNLIILEDDPYYFVQFQNREEFSPSFLNLDEEGRVIRFDSFSKVLSSGIRLGFVTGPKPLVRAIVLHMQACILHTSSLSQVLVSELLSQWGEEGFLEHTEKVQQFYKERSEAMLEAAEKHLKGLCEWSTPTGGMFLWMKVPELEDTWDMILNRGLEKNVILVPGRAFSTEKDKPSNYMRAAFSLASPEKMDLGMKFLAQLIREEIKLEKK